MKRIFVFAMAVVITAGMLACSESPIATNTRPTKNLESDIRLLRHFDDRFGHLPKAAPYDIGAGHNDILLAFDRRRALNSTQPITHNEFTSVVARSINQVMVAHNEPFQFNQGDIGVILEYLETFRPTYDFAGKGGRDVEGMITQWEQTGFISPQEAEEFRALIAGLITVGDDNRAPKLVTPERAAAVANEIARRSHSPATKSAARVMAASVAFWSKIPVPPGQDNELVRDIVVPWASVGRIISDVLAQMAYGKLAALFPQITIPAYIVTAVASITFAIMQANWSPGADNYSPPLWGDPLL